jgi:hypothetical protein
MGPVEVGDHEDVEQFRAARGRARRSLRGARRPPCSVRPYDRSTLHHAGQFWQRCTSDPGLSRAILRGSGRAGGGPLVGVRGSCGAGWQVAQYADSVV